MSGRIMENEKKKQKRESKRRVESEWKDWKTASRVAEGDQPDIGRELK